MSVIYILTNNTNGKQYVGSTTNELKQRLLQHKASAGDPRTKIAKAIKKFGWENFSCEIVHETDDYEELLAVEGEIIKDRATYGRGGYNNNISGSSTKDVASFRMNTDINQQIRFYMDYNACSFTQAVSDLIGYGHAIWLSNKVYKDQE